MTDTYTAPINILYHKLRSVMCSAECEENDINWLSLCSPWESIRIIEVRRWYCWVLDIVGRLGYRDSSFLLVEGTLVGIAERIFLSDRGGNVHIMCSFLRK